MTTESSDRLIAKSQQSQEREFCPDCGAQMVEVERSSEDGVLFVWYECSRDNCDGQWLQKIAQMSLNNSTSGESQ